jgi:hypothetical protein
VTADNASNSDTMRRHMEVSFGSQSVSWNANMMRINCLAHVLNFSVQAFLTALDIAEDDDLDDNDSQCDDDSFDAQQE